MINNNIIMKKSIVLLAFLCLLFFGCKKDNENGIDIPTLFNEDLSYLIETYSREERNGRIYEYDRIYDDYKPMSIKHYSNGQLNGECKNYYYDGLDCSYDAYSYNNSNDVTLCQHYENEYLDKTYLRSKHYICKYDYVDNDQEDRVVEAYHEYDGKKQMGYKRFLNGVLVCENNDYSYDGLNGGFTMRNYSNTGDLVNIRKYELQYLDATYLQSRQKITKYTTEYVDGSPTEVYYKVVEYDGKKPMGYKVFVNGTLIEEGRDYVYDGLKCYYKVDHYNDNTLSSTSLFEVHYLE